MGSEYKSVTFPVQKNSSKKEINLALKIFLKSR